MYDSLDCDYHKLSSGSMGDGWCDPAECGMAWVHAGSGNTVSLPLDVSPRFEARVVISDDVDGDGIGSTGIPQACNATGDFCSDYGP